MSKLLNIIESPKTKEDKYFALFNLAFRPFFLLGAAFSIISILLWSMMLGGHFQTEVYGGQLWWHIHEMLFGFVVAIIIGFLLTAVQSWTGVPGIKGNALKMLVAVWLLGRIAILLPQIIPAWIIAVIDLSFLPISAAVLATPIIKVKLWRHIMFVPLLLILTLTNATMHYSVFTSQPLHLYSASTSVILLVVLLMCVMGGRVFPMFTANGTQTDKVPPIAWLEKLAIGSMLLAVFSSFNWVEIHSSIMATIFFIAATAHAVRALRWRIWVTLSTPLVWSLHLSYWCISIGLLLFGLSDVTDLVSRSQAIHTLTVGAMGGMILSMISRVSLGHTGREIVANKTLFASFLLILVTFVVRVFGIYWFENYLHVIYTATFFWVAAYGCFVLRYFPILCKVRHKFDKHLQRLH